MRLSYRYGTGGEPLSESPTTGRFRSSMYGRRKFFFFLICRRPLRDLRISVTDRCNFRCVYCMPKDVFGRDFQFLARTELLTFEEIARLVSVFVSLGVEKLRLTGGMQSPIGVFDPVAFDPLVFGTI